MTASRSTVHQFFKSVYFSQISLQEYLRNMRKAPEAKRPGPDVERRQSPR